MNNTLAKGSSGRSSQEIDADVSPQVVSNDVRTERYITISVDDGFPNDSRAADLLSKYGFQATFYIPARNPEHAVMPPGQIRELSQRFEIGGHTYHHTALGPLPDEKAFQEIHDGKQWLEDILGEPVVSFCYPQGKFNRRTPALVKRAGFLGGRTCLFNLHTFPENPFLWGVSTHACDHSRLIQIRHALLEYNWLGLRNFFGVYKGATNWQTHFLNGLRHVEQHQGIVHLYFHSWEVDELGQWEQLESVLGSAAQLGLTSVTNATLFRLWGQVQGRAAH
jgi:peptidoglycan/xylan/chitin deacetylase (PgdA/CDA1 family)